LRHNKRKDKVNSREFDHRTESIIIINTVALPKNFGHQSSLIAINRTISFMFYFIDPFAVYNISARSRRY
jgi:phage protein U